MHKIVPQIGCTLLFVCWIWNHYQTKINEWPFSNGLETTIGISVIQARIDQGIAEVHCCVKCPQNLQLKTLLRMYTAFTCRNNNKILFKVFDPRNRGNLLLKLQFFVL